MSDQARQNLAPEGGKNDLRNDSKRKMTQAIIDEEENAKKNKDAYEFLEDDDDFEEFDIQQHDADEDSAMMVVDGGAAGEADKKMWQEDWDDEEVDEDFAKQLRAQIKKWILCFV